MIEIVEVHCTIMIMADKYPKGITPSSPPAPSVDLQPSKDALDREVAPIQATSNFASEKPVMKGSAQQTRRNLAATELWFTY
jgi:hypothetical protein